MVFGNISSALYLEQWVIMKLFFHKIVMYSSICGKCMYVLLNWYRNASPMWYVYVFKMHGVQI